MNRNTKLLIASCIGVSVLGAALAVVLSLPSTQTQPTTSDDNNAILLFDKQSMLASEISIQNTGGSYQLFGYDYETSETNAGKKSSSQAESSEDVPTDNSGSEESSSQTAADESSTADTTETAREINMIYTMQEYEDEILYKPYTDELCRECCYMAAKQIIDKSGNRYAEYGLEEPKATVSAVFSDGSEVTLYLGKDAPENKGVYLRMKGDNNVYLVQYSLVEMFFVERLQMFDRTITGSIGKNALVSSLRMEGTAYPESLYFTQNDNVINKGQYILKEPFRASVDESALDTAARGIYQLIGTEVAAIQVKPENLKDYGLDTPYEKVTITATDDKSYTILTSKADDDGKVYIMNEKETTVYRMDKADLSWYSVTVNNLLTDSVIYDELSAVKTADITTSGKTDSYSFHSVTSTTDDYTEGKTTTIFLNQNQISYDNFFRFYTNLEGLLTTKTFPDSLDDMEEIFRFTLTFQTESKDNQDILSFYQSKDKKITAVLNGHIRSEVDSEYALTLIDQAGLLAKGSLIPSLTSGSSS